MGIYDLIDELLDHYHIVSDTAFKGDLLLGKIVKVLREGEYIPGGLMDEDLIEVEGYIWTACQPAEWLNHNLLAVV
jgi:hypothetical protein